MDMYRGERKPTDNMVSAPVQKLSVAEQYRERVAALPTEQLVELVLELFENVRTDEIEAALADKEAAMTEATAQVAPEVPTV